MSMTVFNIICTRPYTCPFSICWWDTMHPFPPLVYTEGVRWTQETKGRKSDNMADYIGVSGKGVGLWSLTIYPVSNAWEKTGEKGG